MTRYATDLARRRHVTVLITCNDCDFELHAHYGSLPVPDTRTAGGRHRSRGVDHANRAKAHVRDTGHTVVVHRKVRTEMSLVA